MPSWIQQLGEMLVVFQNTQDQCVVALSYVFRNISRLFWGCNYRLLYHTLDYPLQYVSDAMHQKVMYQLTVRCTW